MKTKPEIGQTVVSSYRAKWKGVITWVGKYHEGADNHLCKVALVLTPQGQFQPKRKTMVLDSDYLELCEISEEKMLKAIELNIIDK